MILKTHVKFYSEIFNIKSFLQNPTLIFGYQLCESGIPDSQFSEKTMKEVLNNFGIGIEDIYTLDYLDKRADIIHNMNYPLDNKFNGKFSTVIDIGSLEHVFDTKTCLSNLFKALKVGGHILLHTPVKGFYNHGLHTFSPELVINSLKLNGFDIIYEKYSNWSGNVFKTPDEDLNVLLWVVAQKITNNKNFICPQQEMWN